MRRWIDRRVQATALLALVALGVYLLGRFLSTKGMSWAGEFGSIASFFLAGFVFVVPLFGRWLRGAPPPSLVSVAQAGDDLAATLARQWTEEEQLRRINDPRPLPVRWEVTSMAETAMLGTPYGVISDDVNALPLSAFAGQFNEILPVFNRVPGRRLVILGPAGAGKSVLVMKLARELLAVRQASMPVPVIISAATWNTDSLTEWIADQLASNHPGLALRVKDATGKITSLAHALTAGAVLPIIDGLDELPALLRGKAITEINARGSDLPLVVTSRPQEYIDAVEASGRAISRAIVVELRPLSLAQVKVYLAEATAALPAGRWSGVFDRLDAEPAGTLATVLTTPLMLSLARTVYEASETAPGDLADRERFYDQASIENYLLDAFVPAIYSRGMDRSRFRCTPRQAERWLAFLAAYLDRTGSPDLAWWRLTGAVRGWRPIGVGIRTALSLSVVWLLAVGVLWRNGDWQNGAYVKGHGLRGLLLGGPLGRLARPAADLVLDRWQSDWRSVRVNLGPWASLPSLELRIGLIAAALSIFSISTRFILPKAMKIRVIPVILATARALFYAVAASLLIILSVIPINRYRAQYNHENLELVDQFVRMPSARALLLLVFLFFLALSFFPPPFRTPANVSLSVSPRKVFRLDLQARLLNQSLGDAGLLAVIWLCSGTWIALAFGVWRGTVTLITLLLGAVRSAADLFADARIWMACGRRLPLRTMSFLSDAHRRGALRQLGAVYQFRHVRLQQRLSARHSRWSRRWPALAKIIEWGDVEITDYEKSRTQGTVVDRTHLQVRHTGLFAKHYRDARFDDHTLLGQDKHPQNGETE